MDETFRYCSTNGDTGQRPEEVNEQVLQIWPERERPAEAQALNYDSEFELAEWPINDLIDRVQVSCLAKQTVDLFRSVYEVHELCTVDMASRRPE